MSGAIKWDETGKRFFEAGVDHVVLYRNGIPGVPWNGVISIEEGVSGGESTPYYLDGVKYYDDHAAEDFSGSISAFTYPDEFEACDGFVEIAGGMVVGYQDRETFGLAWRTKLGNDIDGVDHGYRIHLLYGVTASPATRARNTLDGSPSAMALQWNLDAVPVLPGIELNAADSNPNEWVWPAGYNMPGWPKGPDGNTPIKGWKATPYVYVDSTKLDGGKLDTLNNHLFGSSTNNPAMPSQFDLAKLANGEYGPNGEDMPFSYPVQPPQDPSNQALQIVYTETYKDAIDDQPGSIHEYGPENLTDDLQDTTIVLDSSQAADWFVYFNTAQMTSDVKQLDFLVSMSSDGFPQGTDPMTLSISLFDATNTMDSDDENAPINQQTHYHMSEVDYKVRPGFHDYKFSINQNWLDAYSADKMSVENASHPDTVPMEDFVAAVRSAPYMVMVLSRDSGFAGPVNIAKVECKMQTHEPSPLPQDVPNMPHLSGTLTASYKPQLDAINDYYTWHMPFIPAEQSDPNAPVTATEVQEFFRRDIGAYDGPQKDVRVHFRVESSGGNDGSQPDEFSFWIYFPNRNAGFNAYHYAFTMEGGAFEFEDSIANFEFAGYVQAGVDAYVGYTFDPTVNTGYQTWGLNAEVRHETYYGSEPATFTMAEARILGTYVQGLLPPPVDPGDGGGGGGGGGTDPNSG